MAHVLSLPEFLAKFPNDEACWRHLVRARWPNGFQCPRCRENERFGFIETRNLFQCNACQYQASVTAGTIMEDTKLPLTQWFLAAHLVLTTKKSITSHELARKLGVKQETAWYLQQRLARVVRRAYGRNLFGLVEVDETYVGGKTRIDGRGSGKRVVVALVENKGTSAGSLRLRHVPNASLAYLEPVVVENVAPGSVVRTDGWAAYQHLEDQGYDHVVRAQGDVSRAKEHLPWVHVVFSNLKRVLHGVHTKAADDHLQGQLDLFRFRFDNRSDLGRGLAFGLAALVATPRATRSELKNGTPAEEFY